MSRDGLLMASSVLLWSLSLFSSVQAQSDSPRAGLGTDARSSRTIVFEGCVLAGDGLPAGGAVVMSSAGGSAPTDRNGRYRLQARVSDDAATVQLTAVGGAAGSELASTEVVLSAASALVAIEPLVLAPGSTCQPRWLPTFGAQPGVGGGRVHALAVYDDGRGPAVYAGGNFVAAGSTQANQIARWDGSRWETLRTGVNGALEYVRALAVYDDGRGPALYVGGKFTSAGPTPASNIARWDGSNWEAVGGGVSGPSSVSSVRALTVHDEGNGPALYAGGNFTSAGGVVARCVAKWNGSSWSALGAGLVFDFTVGDSMVLALTSFDDGNGPALYAGGSFTASGSLMELHGIAKWNGSSWRRVGGGVSGLSETVAALTSFDDGNGPALYAGGSFDSAGGATTNHIARWDGSVWTGLGGGTNEDVLSLAVYDGGSGPALCAGGSFTSADGVEAQGIARWDGAHWSALGDGVTGLVSAMTVQEGSALFVGGAFPFVGELLPAGNIGRWNGSAWEALGGLVDSVNALAVHDDGRGEALFAATVRSISLGAARIARWDGARWKMLDRWLDGEARALLSFDDGSGPALYAGGQFFYGNYLTSEQVTARKIARWDGARWAALGAGMNEDIEALAVYDDGGGPALYAAGDFTTAGGGAANHVAKWDGTAWAALGSGTNEIVQALAVFDDGTGPALYAGGEFTVAGGVAASGIAKWDGAGWSALGSGVAHSLGIHVQALVAYDDGSGPALYAGGLFSSAGGVPVSNIAKWDGSSWSALGSGTNSTVLALGVHDDGGGPALYAGGRFTGAGGVAVQYIASWNGSRWSALGGGTQELVLAFATFDGPERGGPALIAGGSFRRAHDSGDSLVARWQGCPDTTPPVLGCPSSITVPDAGLPGEVVTFTVTASDDRDASPSLVCEPPSGSVFPPGITLVQCKATDAAGNQSGCSFPVNVVRKQGR